jgi:hypothetical protein
MIRKVYLDFQDGNGYIDISNLVKYNSFSYTRKMCNDTFRYAQNTCSFDVIYDASLYPKLRYVTKDILVKILAIADQEPLLTELNTFLLTEASFYLLTEGDTAIAPFFYGRITPDRSREYNGKLDNTMFKLSAVDDMDTLDKEVGDVVYWDYKIYDPNDTSRSIIHQLGLIAGLTLSQFDPSVTINTVVSPWAPPATTDKVKDLIDTLLFEYGYCLNFDSMNRISPIAWIRPATSTFTFGEDNIIRSVSVNNNYRDYEGAELVWYEVDHAVTTSGQSDILIYRDSALPYNSDGSFAGYPIPGSTFYPPKANVIDPVTSGYVEVYQDYSSDAVEYWTNFAIKNKLDYNYKAFESDFSAIVATKDHRLDYRAEDSNIVVTTSGFYNKRARILLKNNAVGFKKLYYLNIYADVYYKSTERKYVIENVVDTPKINKYESTYIYDSVNADRFIKALAAQYAIGSTTYTFESEMDVEAGDMVRIILNDGTDQICLVRDKSWNEGTELYKYVLRGYSADTGVLSSQTVNEVTTVKPQEIITIQITPSNISVSANNDGSSPDLTNAYFDVYVNRGSLDDTDGWDFSASTSGITGSFGTGATRNRFIVSGFTLGSTMNGTVTITASRAGFAPRSVQGYIEKIITLNAASVQDAIDAQTNAEDYADSLAAELQDEIDGKITCFYQNDPPTVSGLVSGDLWVDTNDGNNLYRYSGSAWVDVQDTAISTAYNLANTKNTVWASLVAANAGSAVAGDMFLDSSLLYRATVNAPSISVANSTRITPKRYPDVANTTARNALTGMIANDTVYQTDTGQWYYYTTSWQADGTSLVTVAQQAPKYLGAYAYNAGGSGYPTANPKDTILAYTTTSGAMGIYEKNTSWDKITNPSTQQLTDSWPDICAATTSGYLAGAPYGTIQDYIGTSVNFAEVLAVQTAFVNKLFTNFLKVNASLRGGDRYDETGATIDGTKSGFFFSGLTGGCKVAGIEFEGSLGGGVQWGTPHKIGTDTTISGAGFHAICSLGRGLLAHIDSTNDNVQAYTWDGSRWVATGTPYAISGAGTPSLTRLQDSVIACIDGNTKNLISLRWGGSSFSAESSATVSGIDVPSIAALDWTKIAMVDQDTKTLRTVLMDGTVVGNALAISTTSFPKIVALSPDAIAMVDAGYKALRRYSFDGSDWTLDGTMALGALTTPTVAALNGTDVVVFDATYDTIRMFRWTGAAWLSLGTLASNMQFASTPTACAINGSDVVYVDSFYDALQTFRFSFAVASPYLSELPP